MAMVWTLLPVDDLITGGLGMDAGHRIWTRAADFEPFFVDADVDTDVRLLLEPHRRIPV